MKQNFKFVPHLPIVDGSAEVTVDKNGHGHVAPKIREGLNTWLSTVDERQYDFKLDPHLLESKNLFVGQRVAMGPVRLELHSLGKDAIVGVSILGEQVNLVGSAVMDTTGEFIHIKKGILRGSVGSHANLTLEVVAV